MLYKTICVPVSDYCDIMYDNLSQKDSFRLQKLRNSALRIVSMSGRCASVTELYYTYHLDYLVNLRHRHVYHYAYKGFVKYLEMYVQDAALLLRFGWFQRVICQECPPQTLGRGRLAVYETKRERCCKEELRQNSQRRKI